MSRFEPDHYIYYAISLPIELNLCRRKKPYNVIYSALHDRIISHDMLFFLILFKTIPIMLKKKPILINFMFIDNNKLMITWYKMTINPISSFSSHALWSLTTIKAYTPVWIVINNTWKKTMTITAGYFFVTATYKLIYLIVKNILLKRKRSPNDFFVLFFERW